MRIGSGLKNPQKTRGFYSKTGFRNHHCSYIYSGKSNFSFVNSLYKKQSMKAVRTLFICVSLMLVLSSCKLWGNIFKPKYGCKTDGRNIGAEKLATGDPESEKAARKAKKFKS